MEFTKKIYVAGYSDLDYITKHYYYDLIIRKKQVICLTIEECSDVLILHDLRFHPSTAPDEEMAKILNKNIIHERDL